MSRRRAVVAVACVAGAAVLVTGGVLVGQQSSPAEAETVSQSIRTATADVVKGDLNGKTTKQGTLGGTAGTTVPAGPSGTLTSIPAVGTVVHPRDELYRVDDRPVTYFSGSLPQWRSFESGMTDGPDVKQLEENLNAWGYLRELPTAHFDGATRKAIDAWQKATGQSRTGTIEMGRIWFGTGDQVVSSRSASVGQPVGPGAPLYETTGSTKVVTVDLPIGSPLATVGGDVEVTLPVGGSVTGSVTEVGDPATDDKGATTVPVSIGLDDPAKVGDLDQVDVTVDFVSETRKDVLSVPVTALGARAGGGFVVQVVGSSDETKSVPVEVGLFAGDRVEITTGKISVGQKVVVPA